MSVCMYNYVLKRLWEREAIVDRQIGVGSVFTNRPQIFVSYEKGGRGEGCATYFGRRYIVFR